MNEGDSTWSLGILIGIPVAIMIICLCLAIGRWLHRWAKDNPHSFDTGHARFLGWLLYLLAALTIIITALVLYPWKAEYHQYVTKIGTVERIESRVLGSDDSFQQKFVALYTDGRRFGCEDTRCALVKPGDRLTLACKRTWQYAGVDGYDCNFLAHDPKGEMSE